MNRINHTLAYVTLAIILASTGCGDPGTFDETASQDTSRVADDAVSADDRTPTLEDELQLACEAYCEAVNSCRRAVFPVDCAEHCWHEHRRDADDACIAAEIDLLNCYSPSSCDSSPGALEIECAGAMLGVRAACSASELRRDVEDDGEIRIVEMGDRELTEVDGDPEEPDPSEESGDEEPGDSDDSDPVFELPEIPDFPYFPEPGAGIELP